MKDYLHFSPLVITRFKTRITVSTPWCCLSNRPNDRSNWINRASSPSFQSDADLDFRISTGKSRKPMGFVLILLATSKTRVHHWIRTDRYFFDHRYRTRWTTLWCVAFKITGRVRANYELYCEKWLTIRLIVLSVVNFSSCILKPELWKGKCS